MKIKSYFFGHIFFFSSIKKKTVYHSSNCNNSIYYYRKIPFYSFITKVKIRPENAIGNGANDNNYRCNNNPIFLCGAQERRSGDNP